jgi:hypothetical protein
MSGLQLLWYTLFNDVVMIRYRSANRFGRWIIALIQRFRLCLKVHKIQFDFSSNGLWYWVQAAVEDVSKNISIRLSEDGNFMDYISEKIEHTRRFSFVRRALGIDLYRPMTLSLLAHRDTISNAGKLQKVVMLDISDVLPLFINASKQWIKEIKFISLLNLKKSFGLRLVWFLMNQCRVLGGAIFDIIRGKARLDKNKTGTVAIQYIWGTDRKKRLNDLWWYDEMSTMDKSRCLIFFNHPKEKATDQNLKDIENAGCQFRILDQVANKTSSYSTDRYSTWMSKNVFKDCISLVKVIFWAGSSPAPFWQLQKWLSVLYRIRQWQAFMEAENVKVIFDVVESRLDIVSLAADMVGAIKLGVHWGNYAVPYARLTPVHQVQFIWGPRFQSVMKAMGAGCEVIVPAGCIFDNGSLKTEWRMKAKMMRTSLQRSGVKHIVSVLDKSCSPENLHPPAHHIEFYEKLLSWAENNSEIGLIIKPKNPVPGVLTYKPELMADIQKLIAANRAIMIDGERNVVEAAFASDLVVALGLSSAGVLSALADVPTVFWDPSFGSKGPLKHWIKSFGWDNENYVFETMDRMIDSADRYLNCKSEMSGFGDLSAMVDEIDNFRDGKTAVRVGSFVQWFLEVVDQGLDRNEALKIAAEKYQSKWGKDKICSNL